jgi:hypothetical protein
MSKVTDDCLKPANKLFATKKQVDEILGNEKLSGKTRLEEIRKMAQKITYKKTSDIDINNKINVANNTNKFACDDAIKIFSTISDNDMKIIFGNN